MKLSTPIPLLFDFEKPKHVVLALGSTEEKNTMKLTIALCLIATSSAFAPLAQHQRYVYATTKKTRRSIVNRILEVPDLVSCSQQSCRLDHLCDYKWLKTMVKRNSQSARSLPRYVKVDGESEFSPFYRRLRFVLVLRSNLLSFQHYK